MSAAVSDVLTHLSLSTICLSRKIKALYISSRHRISLPLFPTQCHMV